MNSPCAEFNYDVHSFHSRPEIPFSGKFDAKIQNCLFKVKFGTPTNSNMQNSMMMFTFSVFDQKYAKFNGNVQFFLFDWKYLFWASLIQKIKIVSLSWHLASRLTRIWKIQWWCSLFLFSNEIRILGKFEKGYFQKKREEVNAIIELCTLELV